MGGYDLFVCKREGAEWSAPKNLGASLNTTLDDTHLQISADLQKIIWASVSEIELCHAISFHFPTTAQPIMVGKFNPTQEAYSKKSKALCRNYTEIVM